MNTTTTWMNRLDASIQNSRLYSQEAQVRRVQDTYTSGGRVEYNVQSWIRVEPNTEVEIGSIHTSQEKNIRNDEDPTLMEVEYSSHQPNFPSAQVFIQPGDRINRWVEEHRVFLDQHRTDSVLGLRGENTVQDISEDFNKTNLGSESVYSTVSLDKSSQNYLSVSQFLDGEYKTGVEENQTRPEPVPPPHLKDQEYLNPHDHHQKNIYQPLHFTSRVERINQYPGHVPSSIDLFLPAFGPSPSPTPNLAPSGNEETRPVHESRQIITESKHHDLDAALNYTEHISPMYYPVSCSDNLTTCVIAPLQNDIQMTTCAIAPSQNDIQVTTSDIDPPQKQPTNPFHVPPITNIPPNTPALGLPLNDAQLGPPALGPPLKDAQMGPPALGPPLKDAQMGPPALGFSLNNVHQSTPPTEPRGAEKQTFSAQNSSGYERSSVSPQCFSEIEKLVVPSSTLLDKETHCQTSVFADQGPSDLVPLSSSSQGSPVNVELSGPSPGSLVKGKHPTVPEYGCLNRTENPILNQLTPMLRMVEKVNWDCQDKSNQHEEGRFPLRKLGVEENPGETIGQLLDSIGAEDSSIHQVSRHTMEWESGCKPQYSDGDERFNSSIRKRRHETVSSNEEKSINVGEYHVPGFYLNINPGHHTICSSDLFGRSDLESSPPFVTENKSSLPRFRSGSKENEKIGNRLTSVFDLSLDEIENEYSGEEDELSLENQEPASKKEKLIEDTIMRRGFPNDGTELNPAAQNNKRPVGETTDFSWTQDLFKDTVAGDEQDETHSGETNLFQQTQLNENLRTDMRTVEDTTLFKLCFGARFNLGSENNVQTQSFNCSSNPTEISKDFMEFSTGKNKGESACIPEIRSRTNQVLSSWSIQNLDSWKEKETTPSGNNPDLSSGFGRSRSSKSLRSVNSVPSLPNRVGSGGLSVSNNAADFRNSVGDFNLRSSNEEDLEENLLSLFFGGGRLGGALYNTLTCKLSLFNDLPDAGPEFEILSSLIHQTAPNHVIYSARQDETFRNKIKSLCGADSNISSVNSTCLMNDTRQDVAYKKINTIVRPGVEFAYQTCRRRFQNMNLTPPARSEEWQLIRVSAYLGMNCENMVRAAGGLLKYLDKNSSSGLDLDDSLQVGSSRILTVENLGLEQVLTMNEAAFYDLQIYSSTQQQSGSRAGSWNRKREGLSMFSYMNRCFTSLGSRYLHRMLRCPSADIKVLLNRHEAIAFLNSGKNQEFVASLIKALKSMKNFHRLMKRLDSNHMSMMDWQTLYKSLGGMIAISQLVKNHKEQVPIFQDICTVINRQIYNLRSIMNQVIDFDSSMSSETLTIKPGVYPELDKKKSLHNSLPGFLSTVAEEECKKLPGVGLNVCTVTYIPQVGFVVALPLDGNPGMADYHNIPDYHFIFESNGAVHFKTERMMELDQTFGDVFLDITRLESHILLKLSEAILKEAGNLETGVNLVAELDCILSLSIISLENNWKKPVLAEDGSLEILDGRHPLQELSVTSFISNSTLLGGDNGRIHVLSGPNSSGKSVYMKQIGLIVYLGQLGCWVPAAAARIPIFHQLFTRIQTVESVSLGLSSFLCDINQVSHALKHGDKYSLLLIDEFGKGTAPVDGMALLMGVISNLVERQEESPYALFSSHYHEVPLVLPSSPLLRYFKMKTEIRKEKLIYLFQVVEGACENSEAAEILVRAGIQTNIISRVTDIISILRSGEEIRPDPELINMEEVQNLVNEILELDLENLNPTLQLQDPLQPIALKIKNLNL